MEVRFEKKGERVPVPVCFSFFASRYAPHMGVCVYTSQYEVFQIKCVLKMVILIMFLDSFFQKATLHADTPCISLERLLFAGPVSQSVP